MRRTIRSAMALVMACRLPRPSVPKVIAVASERLVPLGFVFFRAESRRAGRKAQMINYTIDPKIHSYLGNRKDGLAIDGKAF